MPEPCATFTQGSIARHVLSMAGTSALSLLAVFLVDILTLAYVARLADQRLLAAVGLAKTLMFLNGALVSGVVIAAGALLSERIGRHARKRLSRLASHLLIMAAAMAALVAAAQYLYLGALGSWFGAIGGIDQAARAFMAMTLGACVPMAVAQMCAQLLKSQGRPRLALTVLLAGTLTLAVADPLLIFVLGMGIRGAGWACLIAALVSAAFGVMCVQRHLGVSVKLRARLLGVHVRRTARVAIPAMLANLAMPVAITYLMMTLAASGTSAMAGMAVIDRVLQLGYALYFAVPTALVPIVAQNLGAGRDARAVRAVGFTGKLVVLYGVALWLVLAVAGPTVADYFQLAGTGREMFLAFAHYGAGLWILYGLDFVAQSMFLSMGGAWWVPVFGWLRGTAGSLPFIYAGAQWFGGTGAVAGMWLGNAGVAVLAVMTALLMARRFFRQRSAALH